MVDVVYFSGDLVCIFEFILRIFDIFSSKDEIVGILEGLLEVLEEGISLSDLFGV